MIKVEKINKSFADKHVLKDVSFSFEAGKTNLVIGASGSGKTTLIKCMVGLHTSDSGKIIFDGATFDDLDKKDKRELRQQIGMLFQGGALFDYLTVEQNIAFPLSMFTNMSEEEKRVILSYFAKQIK